MSDSPGNWLKGCGLGCAGVAVLFVLVIVWMSFSMRSAFEEAHHDREILEWAYGGEAEFTPAVDGTVTADRIEDFLTVREALAGVHAELEKVDREMGEFESMAEDGEPALRESLPAVFRMTRVMMGLPWVFGEVEKTRNRALVEAEMGLGEYLYLYVIAFHDRLVASDSGAHLFSGAATNSRVRAELRSMLRRQLVRAESAPLEDGGLVTTLAAEVAALEADPERIPWQDGLPDRIADSFVPYRQRLDATYSAPAAEFELLNSTIHGGGLRIEMD